jgi:hypothetical protein
METIITNTIYCRVYYLFFKEWLASFWKKGDFGKTTWSTYRKTRRTGLKADYKFKANK